MVNGLRGMIFRHVSALMYLLVTRVLAWSQLAIASRGVVKSAETLLLSHQITVLKQIAVSPEDGAADRALLSVLHMPSCG